MDILFFSYVVRNLFQKMQLVLKLIDEEHTELTLNYCETDDKTHNHYLYSHSIVWPTEIYFLCDEEGGKEFGCDNLRVTLKDFRVKGSITEFWLTSVHVQYVSSSSSSPPPISLCIISLSYFSPSLPSLCVTFLTLPHSFTSLWCLY